MKRVQRLLNLRAPIREGYFPKLNSQVASRGWPARFDNTTLKDLRRESEQIIADIDDMERWRDRIFSAFHSGFIMLVIQ